MRLLARPCRLFRFLVLLAVLPVGGLAGCRRQEPTRAPVPGTPRAMRMGLITQAAMGAKPEELTPLESGPGVIVAEPVGRGATAETLAFGTGCGRWLFLTVGGQPEFGKTPLWTEVGRLRRTLRRRDLRLTAADGPAAAQHLGVTHLAVGTVSGTPRRCTLTYRLYQVPEGKPVGSPVTASSTEAAVAARLPEMARELCRQLGVAEPDVPAKTGETAPALRAVGRFHWSPGEWLTPEEQEKLDNLAHVSPLAAMHFLINRAAMDDQRILQFATDSYLLPHRPRNAQAMAEIGNCSSMVGDTGRPKSYRKALEELLARHPNNYLLRAAEMYLRRAEGDWTGARKAAEHAVRCAPRNGEAWVRLAGNYGEHAEQIRRGVFASKLTPEQDVALAPLYAGQLLISEHATRVDPGSSTAWNSLSNDAAFAGERELADRAFWRALELAPDDPRLYDWGLQLYHPKWQDDRQKAERVARLALAAALKGDERWTPVARVRIAAPMWLVGFPELAREMVRTPEERKMLAETVEARKEQQVE